MHSIHQVVIASYRVLRHQMDVLIPVRAAHENQRMHLGDAGNDAYQLLGIGLEFGPAVFDRLVIKLINHVGAVGIAGGHLGKEILCFVQMQHMRMPVHNHIGAALYRPVNHVVEAFEGKLRLSHIAPVYAGVVGLGVVVGTDRSTEYGHAPVFVKMLHGFLVVETRPDVVPAETYTPHYDRFTFSHKLGALNFQGGDLRRGLAASCEKSQDGSGQSQTFLHILTS